MSCASTEQCDVYRGLSCGNQSNICECSSDQYWNFNWERCRENLKINKRKKTLYLFLLVQRVNYSEACARDGDCVPTLTCPILPGVCNCPQYLPDYVCNCAENKYYDATIAQCGKMNLLLQF